MFKLSDKISLHFINVYIPLLTKRTGLLHSLHDARVNTLVSDIWHFKNYSIPTLPGRTSTTWCSSPRLSFLFSKMIKFWYLKKFNVFISPHHWSDIYHMVYNSEIFLLPLIVIVSTYTRIYILLTRYVLLVEYHWIWVCLAFCRRRRRPLFRNNQAYNCSTAMPTRVTCHFCFIICLAPEVMYVIELSPAPAPVQPFVKKMWI